MGVALRAATAGDLDAILGLYGDVWAWLREHGHGAQWGDLAPQEDGAFRERMERWVDERGVTVADSDGRVVGVLGLGTERPPYLAQHVVPPDALYLYSVATARDAAGRGVGELLMARAAATAGDTPIALDHWAASPALGRIYESYGYEVVARFDDVLLRIRQTNA